MFFSASFFLTKGLFSKNKTNLLYFDLYFNIAFAAHMTRLWHYSCKYTVWKLVVSFYKDDLKISNNIPVWECPIFHANDIPHISYNGWEHSLARKLSWRKWKFTSPEWMVSNVFSTVQYQDIRLVVKRQTRMIKEVIQGDKISILLTQKIRKHF